MKKIILLIVLAAGITFSICFFQKKQCPLPSFFRKNLTCPINTQELLGNAFNLLKVRKNNEAIAIFENVLYQQPDNTDALWGKAEVLRRENDYAQAEELLRRSLQIDPKHNPSIVALSYLRYKAGALDEAQKLINRSFKDACLGREDQAMAYMVQGAINARRASKRGFLNKIRFGTQIKGYFLKATKLAPDLPEVHVGLGTFYLLAPAIAGGDLQKALMELELSVKLAPDFATANALLAQVYLKKGDNKKYNFYIERARKLDPKNEYINELNEEYRNR